MLPRISNLFGNGKVGEGRLYLEQSLKVSMCLVVPICFGMMAVAREFVPLFYGEGFESCADIYQYLLLSCIFYVLHRMLKHNV